MSTSHLIILSVIYCAISYYLLLLANEQDLFTPFSNFIYFLTVTASTVGYGDLTPKTELGKYVVALFIIPFGLSLFAFTVGHIATTLIDLGKHGILGKRRVRVADHIIIMGWNGQRTVHLIEMLLHGEDVQPIVLCVREKMENPMPQKIEFVHTDNFTNASLMHKARVNSASSIIIDNDEDDITFTAALFCAKVNPSAHILAYFHDEILSNLLSSHCPNAECIPSVAVEMMAKSALDPGSSILHQQLLNSKVGMTQFTVVYPKHLPNTTVEELFFSMKKNHQATLIGFKRNKEIALNPSLDSKILPQDVLFYIADARVTNFNW